MSLLDDFLRAHYLIPDCSDEFLKDSQPQIYIELPYPIGKPFKYIEEDVIAKFHEKLEENDNQLQTLHKEFYLGRDKIVNQSFENCYASITKGLLDFCKTEKCDMSFNTDYNPYYVSGFLENFYLNGIHYLIRPDCKNNLRLIDIAKPSKSIKLYIQSALNENIHGIKSINNSVDILLLLQHETEVNLIQIQDISENTETRWNKKFKRQILDSKFIKANLGVILSNTKFKLYDIETGKRIHLKNHGNDSSIFFEFIDENNIALLNQECLKIVDQRSGDCKTFQPVLDNCNRLCSVNFDDNLIYVASRHHLLRTDFRFLKPVDYCTHLMKTSPCYMDLIKNGSNKYLCLSSQKVNEKVLFTGDPISSLPLNIPSICDSLTKCQLKKDVLLKDQLNERLQKSIGGIKLICDNNDEVSLYSVNSLGDLFTQKISEEFDNSVSRSIDSLYHWIDKLSKTPKTLYLTNIANLSDARFSLNKQFIAPCLEKFTKKSRKASLFLNHFNNIYNKNNLSDLATNFVSIWEDEEEEEREQVDLVPEVAPLEKVSSWIESSYFLE